MGIQQMQHKLIELKKKLWVQLYGKRKYEMKGKICRKKNNDNKKGPPYIELEIFDKSIIRKDEMREGETNGWIERGIEN